MKYGFSLVMGGRDANPDTFVTMAARAEALELDSLWLSSHVVLPPQVKSGFALVPGRMHPPHWREGYWEPFTVLSFLAAHTTRITLGTSVTVLPMHNPFEVARHVAEVDQLSNGRFIFGIGVGWFEEEFEVLGQNFRKPGRARRRRHRAHDEALGGRPRVVHGPVLLLRERLVLAEAGATPPSAHLGRWCEPGCLSPRRAVRRCVPPGGGVPRGGGRDAEGAGPPVREVSVALRVRSRSGSSSR